MLTVEGAGPGPGGWAAGGLQGYGAPTPGVSSFMVWALHSQGGPRLPGCTIMWGELAHVGRYDLHFRESQEPQGHLGETKCPTPKHFG